MLPIQPNHATASNSIIDETLKKNLKDVFKKNFDIKKQIPLIVEIANIHFRDSIQDFFVKKNRVTAAINWGIRKLVMQELEQSHVIRIQPISIHYFHMIQKAFANFPNLIQPAFQPDLTLQDEGAVMYEHGEIIIYSND